jgi:hypothetical protein
MMKKIKQLILLLSTFLILMGFVSCGSAPASTAPADADVYPGVGRGSLAEAINGAKMDAVKNAVIDMIGARREQANQEQLQEVLYSSRNPNAFVYKDTLVNTRKENLGTFDEPNMVYEITIRVNTEAVESVLRVHGIIGEGSQQTEQVTESTGASTEDLSTQEGDWEEASEDEKRFIRRYIDTMTYMVYYDSEDESLDPFLMKSAVGMANSYLAENALRSVDMDSIEELKKDQQLVYEEETGQEISIIQWIAQKLNADVYIELDTRTEGETKGENYYGKAYITLKFFDPSTGQLLGSAPYESQRTFSKTSEFEAISNAVKSTVYKAMPVAIQQSQELMAKSISQGLRYEVTIQNTSDSKVMSNFRRKMRNRVNEIDTEYQSAEETKYVIYYFGKVDELEDLIYDIASTVPGLDGLTHVLTRGKTLTFNSGM